MGVSIYVSPTCTLAHAHPNALDDVWRLEFGAPLQTSWATTTRRSTNVFVSTLSNTLPLIHSWGSFIISCAAWMQLAILSRYPVSAVRASAAAAVHRVLAKTPSDVPLTLRWVAFFSPRLPQSVGDTVGDLLSWLSQTAACNRPLYASWHIPGTGRCSAFCAQRSYDLAALQGPCSALSLQPQVDWVYIGGGGLLLYDV